MSSHFMQLFVHGIPELDIWQPDYLRDPEPSAPRYPPHPRPVRVLPPAPRLGAALAAELTSTQADLLSVLRCDDALDLIRPCWAPGQDADCVEGWSLIAETLPEHIEALGVPTWLAEEWSASKDELVRDLIELMHALGRASARHDRAEADWHAQVRQIQAAPETDPHWAAYDELVATLPARRQAHAEARLRRAQRITGYATEEEAAAAYWGTHTLRPEHLLLGYAPPRSTMNNTLHTALGVFDALSARLAEALADGQTVTARLLRARLCLVREAAGLAGADLTGQRWSVPTAEDVEAATLAIVLARLPAELPQILPQDLLEQLPPARRASREKFVAEWPEQQGAARRLAALRWAAVNHNWATQMLPPRSARSRAVGDAYRRYQRLLGALNTAPRIEAQEKGLQAQVTARRLGELLQTYTSAL